MNNRPPTPFEHRTSVLKGIYNFCAIGVQWGYPGQGWGYTFFDSPIKITTEGIVSMDPLWTGRLIDRDEDKFKRPLNNILVQSRAQAIKAYCESCPIVYTDAKGIVREFFVDPNDLTVQEIL